MATVFVPDGEQRSALAVVRSLGRAGHRVVVGAQSSGSLAAASRWCGGELIVPDALADRRRFADAVIVAARECGAEVVLPVTDASVLAVLSGPPPAPMIVPMGDYASFAAMSDKAGVAEAAAAVGIRAPRQVRLESPADAASLALGLTPPVVLKPARSVSLAGGARHGVVHASTRDAMLAGAARLDARAWPLLVQERVVGPGVGVFLLMWNGALLAAFAHRRLREKPPSGGVSVYCESIALDPDLLSRSRALVERFGWNGVAMVEFKVDASTGEPVLMEINGRFWGSLQLAIDAGVDFPRLLVDAALGRPPAGLPTYAPGVRSRWWWGEVDHLLLRLTRSSETLSLPPGAPGRAGAVAAFFVGLFGAGKDQVLRAGDPRPFLRESADWIRGVLRA